MTEAFLRRFYAGLWEAWDGGAARIQFHGLHQDHFIDVAASRQSVVWIGAAFFQMRDRCVADIWVFGGTDGLPGPLEATS